MKKKIILSLSLCIVSLRSADERPKTPDFNSFGMLSSFSRNALADFSHIGSDDSPSLQAPDRKRSDSFSDDYQIGTGLNPDEFESLFEGFSIQDDFTRELIRTSANLSRTSTTHEESRASSCLLEKVYNFSKRERSKSTGELEEHCLKRRKDEIQEVVSFHMTKELSEPARLKELAAIHAMTTKVFDATAQAIDESKEPVESIRKKLKTVMPNEVSLGDTVTRNKRVCAQGAQGEFILKSEGTFGKILSQDTHESQVRKIYKVKIKKAEQAL